MPLIKRLIRFGDNEELEKELDNVVNVINKLAVGTDIRGNATIIVNEGEINPSDGFYTGQVGKVGGLGAEETLREFTYEYDFTHTAFPTSGFPDTNAVAMDFTIEADTQRSKNIYIKVDTAFDGTETKIKVNDGSNDIVEYFASDLADDEIYQIPIMKKYTSDTTFTVTFYAGGTVSTGEATIIFEVSEIKSI